MAPKAPKTLQRFQAAFPKVWKSYEALRDACDGAGPLDDKTVALIKVVVEVARRRHGGLIAHIHRAQQAGATAQEIHHAALLAMPLVGFPDALDAFKTATETLDS